VAPS
jgi:hypothetical protein